MNHAKTVQAVTDSEILERAHALPEFVAFPTVDELLDTLEKLRAQHPDLLTVRRLGTSRLGDPIPLYTLHVHPHADPASPAGRSGLVVGGVHPNEPIGSLTIISLVTDLLNEDSLRERLDIQWHIVPCADPDAMRLNEGWFTDPFDDETYFRHFFRPPGHEQVEWTFPISYKKKYFDRMLPETQALQRVIDSVRPDFYVPLHNSETGGAYYYVSPDLIDLVPLLHRLPAEFEIPLHLGEPESAHGTVLAPAVYAAGTAESVYDWRETNGFDPAPANAAGQSSTSYARRHGTVSLIAELPIWRTRGADDTTPTEANYAELLREAGQAMTSTSAELTDLLGRLEPQLGLDSPFLRSATAFIPSMRPTGSIMISRAGQPENDRPATVAERPMSVVWMYRLRYGGALLRALRAEIAVGTAGPEVRRAAAELDEVWSGWLRARSKEESTRGLPIRSVVGVQYGAVLGLAAAGFDRARAHA